MLACSIWFLLSCMLSFVYFLCHCIVCFEGLYGCFYVWFVLQLMYLCKVYLYFLVGLGVFFFIFWRVSLHIFGSMEDSVCLFWFLGGLPLCLCILDMFVFVSLEAFFVFLELLFFSPWTWVITPPWISCVYQVMFFLWVTEVN